MVKLLTLITQMFTVAACILTWLADYYLESGGLFVFILLPVATALMAAPYVIDHFFVEDIDDEEEELSCIRPKQ